MITWGERSNFDLRFAAHRIYMFAVPEAVRGAASSLFGLLRLNLVSEVEAQPRALDAWQQAPPTLDSAAACEAYLGRCPGAVHLEEQGKACTAWLQGQTSPSQVLPCCIYGNQALGSHSPASATLLQAAMTEASAGAADRVSAAAAPVLATYAAAKADVQPGGKPAAPALLSASPLQHFGRQCSRCRAAPRMMPNPVIICRT